MGPMLYHPVSDGPAMVLSPAQDHAFVQFPSQSMLDTASGGLEPCAGDRSSPHAMNGVLSSSPKSGANHSSCKSSNITTSRKRTRDEAALGDDANGEQCYGSLNLPTPAPAPVPEEEPIYGEGMMLLNPRTGIAISAESQTGTWYEEAIEEKAASAPPVSSRSSTLRAGDPSALPSRKSQRLDTSAPGLDDIALASIRKRLQSTSNGDENRRAFNGNSAFSSSPTPEEPPVDEFTRLLGISWQRIGTDDENMAAAVRGWAKYINNHYSKHLQDAQILLKHRGMNAYLVAARPVMPGAPSAFPVNGQAPTDVLNNGNPAAPMFFYLFSEDLSEARLVGSNWDICLQNLRSTPIAFEGTEVLRAAEHITARVVEDKGVPVNSEVRVAPADGVSTGNGSGDLNGDMGMGMGMDIDA